MKRTRIAAGLIAVALFGIGLSAWASEERPSALFKEYCAVCHGEDGKAQTAKGKQLKAQDLTDSEWQQEHDDAQIFKQIAEGGMDMPPFGKKLTKEQIDQIVKQDVRGFWKKD